MSSAILRACTAVLVGSFVVATLAAQTTSSSRLQQIKQLNKVAAQKAEADIRDAVKEAVSLIKSDPSGALEVLEDALHTAKNDAALEESQRAALTKLIAKHIRDAKANGGKSSEPDKAASKQERGVAQRKDDEGAQRVDDIRKLLDRNRDIRQKNRELRGEQGRGLVGVSKDADKSAIPTDKDVKFPKNWPELTRTRTTVQMTKAEKKLMKALDTVIEANFNDAKFEDVIKYLEEKTDVSILLDKQAMEQQGVAYETTVRFRARKVTMRTVLRRILGDVGLAYIVKDEAIQVTTPDRAKETLTTRVYYLGDLVNKLTIDLGPVLNEAQVLENAKQIIDMIQTQIEPESWSINNGPGRIFFEPTRMVLVVKASAEVHYMLGGGSK